MGIFDIFKKKQQPVHDRYAGKPLLKLLDAFVLDAIGELPHEQKCALEAMTPKLREVYKCSGQWQDIVVEVMHWKPEVSAEIRALWAKNQAIARHNKMELSAADFAVMFVDGNVAHT